MLAAIPFPDIDPVLVSFEIGGITLAIRWYALAYIAGFLLARWWIIRALERPELWPAGQPPMTRSDTDDLLTYAILGTILGGRLGYVLFYAWPEVVADPAFVLRIWEGGMSFHGGLLGVALAALLFAWRRGVPLLSLADCLALGVPFGLLLGRIANFINAELWGRPTDVPWAVIFPNAPCAGGLPCGRHPSQIYEAGLEGLALLVLLGWLAFSRGALRRPGLLAGIFFVGYGAARMFVELFRVADPQFITPDNPRGAVLAGLSMGQLLSLPMVLVGLALILWAMRRRA